MKCKKCGTIVSLNNPFCPGCGSILSKEAISTDNNTSPDIQPSMYNNSPSGYIVKENLKNTYKPKSKKKVIDKKQIYTYSVIGVILIIGVIIFFIFTSSKTVKVPSGYVRIGNKDVGYINVPSDLTIYGNSAVSDKYHIEMDSIINTDITLQEIIKDSKQEANIKCNEISEKTFKRNNYNIYNLSCEFDTNIGNLYFIEYKDRIYLISIITYNSKYDVLNIISTFNTLK